MLLLALAACAPDPVSIDTGALRPPCEPHAATFDFPIGSGDDTVAVEHHLGLCSDRASSVGRLTLRRTTPDASCTAVLSFVGTGPASDCSEDCAGAWTIEQQLVESDCSDELAALSLGPEDLSVSPWLGWSIDGRVHGESASGLVELPAISNEYVHQEEGPEVWTDVYGASLLDR